MEGCAAKSINVRDRGSESPLPQVNVAGTQRPAIKAEPQILKKHEQADRPPSTRPLGDRNVLKYSLPYRNRLIAAMNAVRKINTPYGAQSLQEKKQAAILEINHNLPLNKSQGAPPNKNYPESLTLLATSLAHNYYSPSNLLILTELVELGVGLNDKDRFTNMAIPCALFRGLLNNTPSTTKAILKNNAEACLLAKDSDYTDLLEQNLTNDDIRSAAGNVVIQLGNGSCAQNIGRGYRLSHKAFSYILPEIIRYLKTQYREDITNHYEEVAELLKTDAVNLLCLLEVNITTNNEELIATECKKLSQNQIEVILLCAFALGQSQLFGILEQQPGIQTTNILKLQCSKTKRNIMHIMASALPDLSPFGFIKYIGAVELYTPAYERLFLHLSHSDLFAQSADKDCYGHTPLALFYHHNVWQLANQRHLTNNYLLLPRLKILQTFATPKTYADCMHTLYEQRRPVNFNWFGLFLDFLKAIDKQQVSSTALPCLLNLPGSMETRSGLIHKPNKEHIIALQTIVSTLWESPNSVCSQKPVVTLLKEMWAKKLPVSFQMQVLSKVPQIIQASTLSPEALGHKDWQALFIEKNYQSFAATCTFYPWHLIALSLQGNCAPQVCGNITAELMQSVTSFATDHPKDIERKELNATWLSDLNVCDNIIFYGRSLAFPSSAAPGQFIRFKFLKQYPTGLVENWDDFIREQSQNAFFQKNKQKLGIESGLLIPKGLYRLPNARTFLNNINTPKSNLADIAVEPDDSALLQVFCDDWNTPLYHHYTYDVKGANGLSVAASFEGIGLFARDAGRLWRAGLQSPDTLSCLHDTADDRRWVSTPFFGGGDLPGTMGSWSAHDYPNIAPAPVGMRDWADVRAFAEYKTTAFGMRNLYFDTTIPEIQNQLRIAELGNTFYGLVINWLRVRHDTNRLDFENPQHIQELTKELTAIAADLFGNAFGMTPEQMGAAISESFPIEALQRAAKECAYWCDPKFRYVQDIREKRFPDKIYADHPTRSFGKYLRPDTKNLTDKGLRASLQSKAPNLGVNTGVLPLCHIDSLLWFCMLTGWKKSLDRSED